MSKKLSSKSSGKIWKYAYFWRMKMPIFSNFLTILVNLGQMISYERFQAIFPSANMRQKSGIFGYCDNGAQNCNLPERHEFQSWKIPANHQNLFLCGGSRTLERCWHVYIFKNVIMRMNCEKLDCFYLLKIQQKWIEIAFLLQHCEKSDFKVAEWNTLCNGSFWKQVK